MGGFSCRTAASGRFGSLLCHVVAVMRGSYINEKQNFSEENSRRAAAGEPILDPYQFFVSDRAENFTRFAKAILPKEVKDTKQINIEEY